MDHRAFSQKGGKARSLAKTVANRAKAAAYWKAVRAGERPAPRRQGPSLDPGTIAALLSGCCRVHGIDRLEIFGPAARAGHRREDGVDLLATFSGDPGPSPLTAEAEMAAILGAPVRLRKRGSVEQMANPYRRAAILAEARVIFPAA